MACSFPPELTELQLAMAMDGEADATVDAHLAACAHCRARAAALARDEARLRAQLFRRFCPHPDALRDYAFDLLDGDEARAVREHLALCPHCTRETFVDYGELLQAPVAPAPAAPLTDVGPPDVLERIQFWVAQTFPGAGGLTPALSLRDGGIDGGNDDGVLGLFAVGSAQISLELEAVFEQPGRQMLVGLVSGVETASMEAHLWRDGSLVAVTDVDGTGSFEFADVDLAAGVYEVLLSGPDVKMRIPDLTIP
jgi:hypothetical protein